MIVAIRMLGYVREIGMLVCVKQIDLSTTEKVSLRGCAGVEKTEQGSYQIGFSFCELSTKR